MDNIAYSLIALRSETSINLSKYVDDIKDIICSINYELDKEKEIKILLNNISFTSIQLILKVSKEMAEVKTNSINRFRKNTNVFIMNKTGTKSDVIGDIIFEIELSEMVVNKMIANMQQSEKKEFDLATAINFNQSIEKILNHKINYELDNENDDDSYRYRGRYRRSNEDENNLINYIRYDEEDLNIIIENIKSTIRLNTDIQDELAVISKLHGKIGKPINYILNIEHTDLCEEEIAQIILSHQYNLGILKKPQIDKVIIDEIINPPRAFFSNYSEEIELPHYRKGMGILILNAEKIIDLNERDLNRLVNFITKTNAPCILIIDRNNIDSNLKSNNNLDKLSESIICREIVINQPSDDVYCNNIIGALKKRGYKIGNEFEPKELISDIKIVYGDLIKVSNISSIVDRIVYNHELYSGGIVIDNFKILDKSNQTNSYEIVETGIEKLGKMIGINNMKDKVKEFIALYRINEERKKLGLSAENISMHMCLKGNPGTGKTTFARVFGQILKDENIISKGTFIEVSRDDLVGKYVGWTANIISDYFRKAEGGVLFIDEAYLLSSDFERGYGEEAMGTIVKNMENYRDRVVVIFAGYPFEMDKFISANPGMKSRIGLDITIGDYSEDELMEIFKLFIRERNYEIDKEVLCKVQENIHNMVKNNDGNFGNARYIRNLVEKIQLSQAKRISMMEKVSKEDLVEITLKDLNFLDFDKSNSYKDKNRTIGFNR